MTDFDQEIFERHAENHRRMHDIDLARYKIAEQHGVVTISDGDKTVVLKHPDGTPLGASELRQVVILEKHADE